VTRGARAGESRRTDPPTSAPAVLLIGYAADTDLAAVSAALDAAGIANLLWLYDARADDLAVDARPGAFRLQHGDAVLSGEDFARARVVVHRSGLGHWHRPVSAPSAAGSERDFTEREWASLLHGLFLEAEQRYPHLTWLNRPSVSAVTGAKYDLLASADLDGLTVPDLRVSTDGHLPRSGSGQYVCKAIGEDERIDDATTYCTSLLDAATLDELPYRSNCPSLIQERVVAEYELRVYYLLAETLAVRIRASRGDYADLRLLQRSDWSAEVASAGPQLHGALRAYCERRSLSYCVFDFLRTADGRDLLIDVTPSGTWSYLENPGDPVVTSWFAGIVARAIYEGRPSDLTYIRPGR
jgi:hypothetical protein